MDGDNSRETSEEAVKVIQAGGGGALDYGRGDKS